MTWLASHLLGTPLLIHRPKLDVILSVVGARLGLAGVAPTPALDAEDFTRTAQTYSTRGIAVIPIYGSLVKRTMGLEAASGLTSYGEIAAMLDAALADPQVEAILLDIDSPGGEVSGCFELARQVRAAAGIKPVWALANDAAYSAAYALAASAQRVFVSETGGVGSIGVIALHVDQSAKDAQEGYRYSAITAGAHKNDLSPHEPLSDSARAELQAEVDRLYALFTAHVAGMRGLRLQAVQDTQAQLYFGPNAIQAGLADGVASLADVLGQLSAFINTPGRLSPQARVSLQTEACSAVQEDGMPSVSPNHEPATVQTQAAAPADMPAGLPAALQEARTQALADAQLVAELCQLSGQSERTAAFLSAGASVAQVREALLAARAQGAQISSLLAPDASAPDRAPDGPALMLQAVQKLNPKV